MEKEGGILFESDEGRAATKRQSGMKTVARQFHLLKQDCDNASDIIALKNKYIKHTHGTPRTPRTHFDPQFCCK